MISTTALRQIAILKELPDGELGKLAEVLRERRVPKGSFVVYADDPGPSMMFIAEGRAKITLLSRDGKEAILAQIGPGEFFGEIALLTGEERSANVVATDDSLLYVLGKEDFLHHLEHNSGLALAMLRELAFRLRASSNKIGDLALYDVYRRIARTLRSMAQESKTEEGTKLLIQDRPTHQEFASLVGTSREMVTRALKGLEEDGCITIEGKVIEFHKMPIGS